MFVASFQSNLITSPAAECQRLLMALKRVAVFPLDAVLTPFGFAIGRAFTSETGSVCDFRHARLAGGNRGLILDGHLINLPWGEVSRGMFARSPIRGSNGSYTLVEWDFESKSVRVSNDPFGFRATYYWVSRDETKIVLASSLRLMRAAVAGLCPDATAFAEQLLVSSTLGGRTLLKDVRRLLPGSVKTLTPKGIGGNDGALAIPWGNAHHGLSLDEAALLIIDIGLAVVGDWIQHRAATVSLSGGYDSRFLALLARRDGCEIDAVNLGNPEWSDATLAERFCNASGIRFVGCFPPGQVTMSEYVDAVRLVEHVADYLSPSWILAYQGIVSAVRQPVINGFLGGPITGASIGWINRAASTGCSIDLWYKAVNACNIPRSTLAQLCVALDVTLLEDRIMCALRKMGIGATRYQGTYEIECAVRQFGFVSLDTYNLFRNFSTIVVPFVDQRLITLFANLSCEHLSAQRAYHRAVKSLDATGVPFASTSSRLREPPTFLSGPQATIQRTFMNLFHEFTTFLEANRSTISAFLDVKCLEKYLQSARYGHGLEQNIPKALMLMNAAILWSEYSTSQQVMRTE